MPDVVIRDMADFSDWLPTISAWFHAEWRELLDGQTPIDIETRIAAWLTRDSIPTALVAVVDGEVVGTVALKGKELEHFGATPWLAGLFVVPHFRQYGIGTQLLRAAEKKAVAMGMHKLYLYTPRAQRFYAALGWKPQQDIVLPSGVVTVMEKVLLPHDLFQPPPLPGVG
jgi:N-acetylglutamate synthase-like GNAT family acetyltransferase